MKIKIRRLFLKTTVLPIKFPMAAMLLPTWFKTRVQIPLDRPLSKPVSSRVMISEPWIHKIFILIQNLRMNLRASAMAPELADKTTTKKKSGQNEKCSAEH
ncbi:hypothetical protein SUGI_0629850 [Cryptomeria japonica]|nr:hypothetical protein SUGI_0629850 [Cryptomeria japonica]